MQAGESCRSRTARGADTGRVHRVVRGIPQTGSTTVLRSSCGTVLRLESGRLTNTSRADLLVANPSAPDSRRSISAPRLPSLLVRSFGTPLLTASFLFGLSYIVQRALHPRRAGGLQYWHRPRAIWLGRRPIKLPLLSPTQKSLDLPSTRA